MRAYIIDNKEQDISYILLLIVLYTMMVVVLSKEKIQQILGMMLILKEYIVRIMNH